MSHEVLNARKRDGSVSYCYVRKYIRRITDVGTTPKNRDYCIQKIPCIIKRVGNPCLEHNSNWFPGNLTFNHPHLSLRESPAIANWILRCFVYRSPMSRWWCIEQSARSLSNIYSWKTYYIFLSNKLVVKIKVSQIIFTHSLNIKMFVLTYSDFLKMSIRRAKERKNQQHKIFNHLNNKK